MQTNPFNEFHLKVTYNMHKKQEGHLTNVFNKLLNRRFADKKKNRKTFKSKVKQNNKKKTKFICLFCIRQYFSQ